MKLNLGAGHEHVYPGYTNVDIRPGPHVDIVADAKTIPLPDGSADEIMAIHLFEHFYKWDAIAALHEWHRLLKVGGLLVLELPNIIKCCENVISGRMRGGKDPEQLSYWGLYGDPRLKEPAMVHRWGWSPATLMKELQAAGFTEIIEQRTQFHPAGRDHRDMRIEARKGG